MGAVWDNRILVIRDRNRKMGETDWFERERGIQKNREIVGISNTKLFEIAIRSHIALYLHKIE